MQTARPIRRAARMQRNSQASMHINSSTAGSGTICLRKRHGLLQKRSWMSIVSDPNLPQQPSLPSQGPSPAGDAENLHVLVAEPVHEEFIGGMDQNRGHNHSQDNAECREAAQQPRDKWD